MALLDENEKEIRRMVMDSYNDKQKGKGRNYKAFFADLCRDVYCGKSRRVQQ